MRGKGTKTYMLIITLAIIFVIGLGSLGLGSVGSLKSFKCHGIAASGDRNKFDLASSPSEQPKLGDGCYHIFLDVGANIGVHTRFLFEPMKYPEAA